MSPTTHDRDKVEEHYARQDRKRSAFFKVVMPILWLIVIIIVIAIIIYFVQVLPTNSIPIPADATTF